MKYLNPSKLFIFLYFILSSLLVFMLSNLLNYNEQKNLFEHYFFISKTKFEIGENIDIKELVNSSYTILEWPRVDNQKIGRQNLSFKIEKDGLIDNYEVEIELFDNSKPKIVILNKNMSIKLNEEVDLKNNVLITDNDKEAYFYLNHSTLKEGLNQIEVVALDRSMNKESTFFSVDVNLPVKKVVIENIVVPEKENILIRDVSNVKFLFSEGYDMKTAYDHCNEKLKKSKNGACIPIKDSNNIYLGYEFIP